MLQHSMDPIDQDWATGRDIASSIERSTDEPPNPDPESPTSGDAPEPDEDGFTMITRASANLVRAQLPKKFNKRRKPVWTKKKTSKKPTRKATATQKKPPPRRTTPGPPYRRDSNNRTRNR